MHANARSALDVPLDVCSLRHVPSTPPPTLRPMLRSLRRQAPYPLRPIAFAPPRCIRHGPACAATSAPLAEPPRLTSLTRCAAPAHPAAPHSPSAFPPRVCAGVPPPGTAYQRQRLGMAGALPRRVGH
eukprot:365083-Chlamydomonas_euryale.AAC.8